MSLLANFGNVGRAYMRTFFVNHTSYSIAGASSQVLTPAVTPTAGDIQIILVGGSQSRTVTPPAGWTLLTRVSIGGTIGFMWKVATSSEPANYTVNLSGSLGGGASYFQIRNADTSNPVAVHVGNDSLASTSLNLGNYAANTYGIAITLLAKGSTSTWTADNGFDTVSPGSQFKFARKDFTTVGATNTVTWTGTSEDVASDLVFIRARYV